MLTFFKGAIKTSRPFTFDFKFAPVFAREKCMLLMLFLLVKKQMQIFTVAEPSAGRFVRLLCRVAVCIWLKSEKAKQFRKEVTFILRPHLLQAQWNSRMLGKESQRVDSAISVVKQDKLVVLQVLLIKILSLVSHFYHSFDHNELYYYFNLPLRPLIIYLFFLLEG